MSALDMSLEDVIKSKGGNSKRPVRSAKAASNGTKKVLNTERKRSNGVAGALIGTALKAAAAAAVAASKPAPAVAKAKKDPKEGAKETEKSDKPATKPAVQAITPGKAPKGGTEDKLGMSLDDVIRNQDHKKVAEPRDVKRSAGLGGKGGFRQRVAQRQMRQVKQVQKKDKAPVRTMRGRGARQADNQDFWGGGGGRASAWSDNSGGKGRMSDDWGPPAKRGRSDDWGWGSAKGTSKGSKGTTSKGGKGKGGGKSWHDDWRDDSWRDDSWRDDWKDDSYGQGYGYGKGGGKGGWNDEAWGMSSWRPQRPEPMLQWDRAPPVAPVQRVAPVTRREEPRRMERPERVERAERLERAERVERVEKASERNVKKTIRVCNVPKNLEERDIQEAFEDIGRVTKCEVERGVAIITFANSSHAKKAEQTFDRGELNGQTIYVSVQE